MMEGIDLILGKDWLDMVNPLVDWRTNTVYIRSGDQLHRVSGIPAEEVKPCGIVDRGLNGLKDNFTQLQKESSASLQFGQWGELYTSSWLLQHFGSIRPLLRNGHQDQRGHWLNPRGRYNLRFHRLLKFFRIL